VIPNLANKRTLKRRNVTSTKTATKSASKAIKATSNKLKKATRNARLLQQNNELQFIESLLGEDFESLSQARSALKREVKTVKKTVKKALPKTLKQFTPKAIKKKTLNKLKETVSNVVSNLLGKPGFKHPPIPPPEVKQSQPHITVKGKKTFTLRELRDGDQRNVLTYLDDRLNANALDKLVLKPGEQWVAQVPYKYRGTDGKTHTGWANTYEVYPRAYTLFRRLAGYIVHAKISANQKSQWLNQIKIMRFSGSVPEYVANKKAQVSTQSERRKKVSKQLKKKGAKKK
jgi:hypothetical protein